MLPVNTILGELEMVEIYEHMDGPRLFSARNDTGTLYLVYWCDEAEDATGWLYLPVSETRLDELRHKEITLREAFDNPEANYYMVYVGEMRESVESVAGSLDTGFFPPDGYHIEYIDVVKRAG